MTTPPVTTVTARAASAEELTDAQYREIYDELRAKTSLRGFAEFIRSTRSFAWWSKYERGEIVLTRTARQELRAIVGLSALPPTVSEATATADPDATVYQVGEAAADRIVLVGQDVSEPLAMRLNGHLSVTDDPPAESHVTPVTRARRRRTTKTVHLSVEQWNRLSSLRREAGMTWDELADWVARLCGA